MLAGCLAGLSLGAAFILIVVLLVGISGGKLDVFCWAALCVALMLLAFIAGVSLTDHVWTCFVVDNNLFEWAVDDKGWSFIRMVR